MAPRTIDVKDFMIGMIKVVASYRNYKNALGYSFRYYLNDMVGEEEIRLLSIDGVQPTDETISDGSYPYATDFYAVTLDRSADVAADSSADGAGADLSGSQAQKRMENTEKLIDWIRGPQGQSLVKSAGYVPVGQADLSE
jgi:phosphate transport system substrate-binding protein